MTAIAELNLQGLDVFHSPTTRDRTVAPDTYEAKASTKQLNKLFAQAHISGFRNPNAWAFSTWLEHMSTAYFKDELGNSSVNVGKDGSVQGLFQSLASESAILVTINSRTSDVTTITARVDYVDPNKLNGENPDEAIKSTLMMGEVGPERVYGEIRDNLRPGAQPKR